MTWIHELFELTLGSVYIHSSTLLPLPCMLPPFITSKGIRRQRESLISKNYTKPNMNRNDMIDFGFNAPSVM